MYSIGEKQQQEQHQHHQQQQQRQEEGLIAPRAAAPTAAAIAAIGTALAPGRGVSSNKSGSSRNTSRSNSSGSNNPQVNEADALGLYCNNHSWEEEKQQLQECVSAAAACSVRPEFILILGDLLHAPVPTLTTKEPEATEHRRVRDEQASDFVAAVDAPSQDVPLVRLLSVLLLL
ncbi:hypothetical protein ACSSS7_007071 [Eimeria intestinalis]